MKRNTKQTFYKKISRPGVLQRDISVLEKVQRRITRLQKPLKDDKYSERLERMALITIKMRRQRGDMIQMFKIVRGADIFTWHCEARTRIERAAGRDC